MHYWVQQFESNEESFEKVAPETQWLTVNMEDDSQKATSKDPVFIHFERVYLACGSTDLRKSIDGLAVIVNECINLDLFLNNYSKNVYFR